jgi:predicted ATPase
MKQEFRSLSEIAHPHLISMYELLCHQDDWFFTMEFVRDGRNFLTHVQDGLRPMQEPEALPTMATVVTHTRSNTIADEMTMPVSLDAITRVHVDDATAALLPEDAEAPVEVAKPKNAGHPARHLAPERIERVVSGFLQLAEGVHALHAQGKLHRDLKPGNVLVRGDGSVVILDFGLVIQRRPRRSAKAHASSARDAENAMTRADRHITGTIPYMAPEQAAGAPLTEASDWYAVGVMLYEALAGELPFTGDALGILRAKQREEAPELADRVSGVPEALGRLCMGLLRRKPERRPSGRQILAALNQLVGSASVADESEEETLLHEPVFVGRETLLAVLQQAFDHSSSATVIAHVHGRSGSGKSALSRHFLDSIEEATDDPLLIFRGRCYEQESVPYKSMDGVIDELALWLSQTPDPEQRELIPVDSIALAKVAPVFRRVPAIAESFNVAAAAAVPGTDLAELRQRGFRAFGDLLHRIAERHRVILCIDDLQWGDADGLELLRTALAHAPSRLLLLITYRDEYLASSKALQALKEWTDAVPGLSQHDISVGPLTHDESIALLDRLIPEQERIEAQQAEAIVRQAEGNPYFLEELARHARSGSALPQAHAAGLDEILWSRISALAQPELEVLETIAVSGQPIRLLYAQSAAGHDRLPPSGLTTLRMHHFVRTNGSGLWNEVETYHDRIRETVLAHLPPERRRDRHASLAFRLEASGEATPDTLAVHFESGDQPAKAGHFYELAAQESAQALAFARAEEFYKKARTLVAESSAKIRIVERLIHLYTDLARFKDAYSLGREALSSLGLNLPSKFFPPSFVVDLARNWKLMRRRQISSLVDHPLATDPQHIARMQLLSTIGKAAYQIRPELCVAILLKMVNNCLVKGHVRDSSIGYIAVGSIFYGGILGRYKDGYEFGRVSLDLVERYGAARIRPEVNFVIGYFGTSWQRPAEEAEVLFSIAHDSGLATGDLFHFGCASCARMMSRWMRGVPLPELAAQAEETLDELNRFQLHEPATAVLAIQALALNLRHGAAATDNVSLESLSAFGSRHIAHYVLLLELERKYLQGDYTAALEAGKQSAGFLKDSKGMLHGSEHFFWLSLSELALARAGQRKSLSSARKALKRFEHWAQGCEQNFSARGQILRAELLAARHRHRQALENFTYAAATSVRYNQPHLAGLACRLAANSAQSLGWQEQHGQLLQQAAQHYQAWGATAYAATLMAL